MANIFSNQQQPDLKSELIDIKSTLYNILNRIPDRTVTNNNVHFGTSCNGCQKNPIVGDRYKCLECQDFDFCSNCENVVNTKFSNIIHDPNHYFFKIKNTEHYKLLLQTRSTRP